MSDNKVNMSLDDIIKQNRKEQRKNTSGTRKVVLRGAKSPAVFFNIIFFAYTFFSAIFPLK